MWFSTGHDMRYFRKTHTEVHLRGVLNFFEKNDFVRAETALTELIDTLGDKQALTLAYLLRAQLFKQKNNMDFALNDLKMALLLTRLKDMLLLMLQIQTMQLQLIL